MTELLSVLKNLKCEMILDELITSTSSGNPKDAISQELTVLLTGLRKSKVVYSGMIWSGMPQDKLAIHVTVIKDDNDTKLASTMLQSGLWTAAATVALNGALEGPRIDRLVQVNSVVVRGRDWNRGNEDMLDISFGLSRSIQTKGTVTALNNKLANVTWSSGSASNYYRVGVQGKYDLTLPENITAHCCMVHPDAKPEELSPFEVGSAWIELQFQDLDGDKVLWLMAVVDALFKNNYDILVSLRVLKSTLSKKDVDGLFGMLIDRSIECQVSIKSSYLTDEDYTYLQKRFTRVTTAFSFA